MINLGGAVDLSAESFGVTLATEGTIDDAAGGNTLTLAGTEVLTLDVLSATGTIGATNALDTAATVIDADAGGAKLRIDNAGTVTDLQLNADLGDHHIHEHDGGDHRCSHYGERNQHHRGRHLDGKQYRDGGPGRRCDGDAGDDRNKHHRYESGD